MGKGERAEGRRTEGRRDLSRLLVEGFDFPAHSRTGTYADAC